MMLQCVVYLWWILLSDVILNWCLIYVLCSEVLSIVYVCWPKKFICIFRNFKVYVEYMESAKKLWKYSGRWKWRVCSVCVKLCIIHWLRGECVRLYEWMKGWGKIGNNCGSWFEQSWIGISIPTCCRGREGVERSECVDVKEERSDVTVNGWNNNSVCKAWLDTLLITKNILFFCIFTL